jgi:3-methyladenine DNA glycosylase AlkD
MATANEILTELKQLGTEGYRRIMKNHGAPDSILGVKVEDLKKIHKRVKTDQNLAMGLYDSGISEAQYLSAFVCDPEKMTKAQLQKWAKTASWSMISEYTVAWVAAESRFGLELAREWIESKQESIATSGWNTFASMVALKPDEELDKAELSKLLDRVQKEIHKAPDRVRYTMNGFIIAVGGSVPSLTAKAKAVAKAIGEVTVDMGDTSCKVPQAIEYIEKIEKAGRLGKKRKSARC